LGGYKEFLARYLNWDFGGRTKNAGENRKQR